MVFLSILLIWDEVTNFIGFKDSRVQGFSTIGARLQSVGQGSAFGGKGSRKLRGFKVQSLKFKVKVY